MLRCPDDQFCTAETEVGVAGQLSGHDRPARGLTSCYHTQQGIDRSSPALGLCRSQGQAVLHMTAIAGMPGRQGPSLSFTQPGRPAQPQLCRSEGGAPQQLAHVPQAVWQGSQA